MKIRIFGLVENILELNITVLLAKALKSVRDAFIKQSSIFDFSFVNFSAFGSSPLISMFKF